MKVLDMIHDYKNASLAGTPVSETNPYAGMECADELLDLDMFESICDVGVESQDVFVDLALLLPLTSMEDEDGHVQIGTESACFGLESIVEKVKRVGYRGKAIAKKIGDAIVKFVKRIVNIVTNKNLLVKKYGDLIGRLNDKLVTKTFKDASKKITIREHGKLSKFVKLATRVTVPEMEKITTKVEESKSWKTFFNAAIEGVVELCPSSETPALLNTLSAIDNVIKNKTIFKSAESIIKNNTNGGKTKEMGSGEAKSELTGVANKIKPNLEENIKIQPAARKFADVVDKQKVVLLGDETVTDADDDQIILVNKLAPVIAMCQASLTIVYKSVTEELSQLATDMQKLLAESSRV